MTKKKQTAEAKDKKSKYKPIVPALDQALRILTYLGKSTKNKQTLTEICNGIGIHKSKVYSILNTLKQYSFIEKDAQSKTYSVGPGLVISARNFLVNLDQKEIVDPFLKKLAEKTRCTVLLCLINNEEVYIAGKHEGNQDIGFTIRRGFTFPITNGANGKAIVAFMQEAERDKILSGDKLYFYNKEGHVNMKRLKKELSECRRTGYACDIGELYPGITSVCAPLFGPMEKIIGCLHLVGNFSKELISEYGYNVSNAAKEISYKLGADISEIYKDKDMN